MEPCGHWLLPVLSSMGLTRQNAGVINAIQIHAGNLNNCLVLPNTRIKSRLEIHITCLNTVNGRGLARIAPGNRGLHSPYKQVTNHPFTVMYQSSKINQKKQCSENKNVASYLITIHKAASSLASCHYQSLLQRAPRSQDGTYHLIIDIHR